MEQKILSSPGPDAGAALREIGWAELTARLSALRAVRSCAGQVSERLRGSFDSGAARRIDSYVQEEPDVNPNGLGNGKCKGRTIAGVEDDGTSGDRGKE